MKSGKREIVVVGASRGIGAAVAQHFSQKGDSIFSISRSQPIAGKWIQADISTSEGIKSIASSMGESTVDALLFMGGVWENAAFTEQYDFMTSPDEETRFVIAVNNDHTTYLILTHLFLLTLNTHTHATKSCTNK